MKTITSVIVLPFWLNPNSGGGQRSLMMIDALAEFGPVHIVITAYFDNGDELKARKGVASATTVHCEKLSPGSRLLQKSLGSGRLVLPSVFYAVDKKFKKQLQVVTSEVGADVVFFRYAQSFCAAGLEENTNLITAIDIDDRDDQKYASRLAVILGIPAESGPIRLLVKRVARYLQRRLARANLVVFAADEDIWPLGDVKCLTVPNAPYNEPEVPMPMAPDSNVVLFVGTYGHRPNKHGVKWFIENGWDTVRARCPDAELRIVGLGNWGSLADEVGERPGVTYVGQVDDLAAEYQAARVCLCPVREGGGSKIKLIEAAAFSRPVVAETHSLRGYNANLSDLIASAATAEGMGELVADYLQDRDKAASDGAALRAAQEANYSRQASVDSIVKGLRETLE